MWSRLAIGTGLVIAFAAVGCADARCDPNPVGEPWKKYESLLPDQAVVCGPNRHSAKKPGGANDNYPPTQVFVFFETKDPAAAMLAAMKKFEAAGWSIKPDPPIGEGKNALYAATATKDKTTIRMDINRNDWGTQGSFKIE